MLPVVAKTLDEVDQVSKIRKKKELIDRWETDPEWIDKRLEIQGELIDKSIEKDYVKVDLRGIKFAKTDKHVPWVEGKVFIEIDFSYADLSRCRFVKCKFLKCTFSYCTFRDITEKQCEFTDCIFFKGRMSGWIGGSESYYRNVIFKQINLGGLQVDYPDFENCIFENCNLKRVDFNGALIKDVKFIGEVSDVWFRGKSGTRDLVIPQDMDKERAYKLNPMIADFSQAFLSYTLFTDGCDLTRAVLPKDGNHYLIEDICKVKEFVERFCSSLEEKEKNYFNIIKEVFLIQRKDETVKILNTVDWRNSMTKDESLKENAQIIFDRFMCELKKTGYIF